jgi:hypothetical protein
MKSAPEVITGINKVRAFDIVDWDLTALRANLVGALSILQGYDGYDNDETLCNVGTIIIDAGNRLDEIIRKLDEGGAA